ncbi:MAG: hypothetical protein SVV67_05555 [Bacillota bacterium]|nr:hypothetical protein [Bacillota bacterium]
MSLTIPAALKAVESAKDALLALAEWKRKNRGNARALILEIEDNYRYLRMVAFDEVALNDIVDSLSVDEYKRLVREGFDINQLKKKKIKDDPSFKNSQFYSWVGKSTEELVDSIYSKIANLKILYPHNKANKKYRWGVRINATIKVIQF